MSIPAVDLEISGICNLRCPVCWGTPRGMIQKYSLKEWFNLLVILKRNAGLKSIVLCGGEPTLIPKIDKFVKHVKTKLNLKIYFETNCISLRPLLPKIAPYIDNLSIPLEGSNPEINAIRRGPLAFSKTIEVLDFMNEAYPNIHIKVGTCVFKQNAFDVPNIGWVLLRHGFNWRYPHKGVWKLYQITRFGAGKDDPEWSNMKITKDEFQEVVNKALALYKNKISITAIASHEMGGYCIIIRPNGEVVSNAHTQYGEEYSVFPNIFSDPKQGIKKLFNTKVKCG